MRAQSISTSDAERLVGMMFRAGGCQRFRANLSGGHTNARERHLDCRGAESNSYLHETNEWTRDFEHIR